MLRPLKQPGPETQPAGSRGTQWWRNSILGLTVGNCRQMEFWRRGNARSFTANKQTRGVLGEMSEGTQWIWGESNAKAFDGERTCSLIAYPKAHCVSECEEFGGRVNEKGLRANQQTWGIFKEGKQGVLQQISKRKEF